MMKKAAMFGLDARIALAIFGVLSVISGAALYSGIQYLKKVSVFTGMQEVKKAVEHLMIDSGANLPEESSAINTMNLGDLYTNYDSVNNWNGPYIGVS